MSLFPPQPKIQVQSERIHPDGDGALHAQCLHAPFLFGVWMKVAALGCDSTIPNNIITEPTDSGSQLWQRALWKCANREIKDREEIEAEQTPCRALEQQCLRDKQYK